jgi:hypothetical protein
MKHHRRAFRLWAAAGVVVTCLALGGVWLAQRLNPALGDSADLREGWSTCLPVGSGRTVTLGDGVLQNGSNAQVVITDIELVRPRGVSLIEAVVLPVQRLSAERGGGTRPTPISALLGSRAGYPPAAERPEEASAWARRRPAVGARIPPGHGLNLVLGVKLTSADREAAVGAIAVTYRSGWASHTYLTGSSTLLRTGPGATCAG